jgi:hypothetical protein
MDIAWMRDHFLQTSESGNKMLIAAAPEQIHQYPQTQVYTTGLYVPPIPTTYDMDDDQNMVLSLIIYQCILSRDSVNCVLLYGSAWQ